MRRKKKNTSSGTRPVEIFALKFPLTNSVYVGRSTYKKHWDLYYQHHKGHHLTTKRAVEQHIAKGVYPQLFILDTVEKTKYSAYQERLAWYKYFIQHGFSVECEPSTKEILSDFDGEAEEIYQKIKDYPLDSIIAPEKDVAAGYRRNKIKETTRRECVRYNLRVNNKEYEEIKRLASEYGMSINRYVISSAMNSVVKRVEFDVEPIKKCYDRFDQIGIELDALITTIILSKEFFPADVEAIKTIGLEMIEAIHELRHHMEASVKKLDKE